VEIFYKRVQTWQKWPNNDVLDTDIVYFSKSKKKFEKGIIVGLDPKMTMKEREDKMCFLLGVKKLKLTKLK